MRLQGQVNCVFHMVYRKYDIGVAGNEFNIVLKIFYSSNHVDIWFWNSKFKINYNAVKGVYCPTIKTKLSKTITHKS